MLHGEVDSIQTGNGGAERKKWQENMQINSKEVMVNLRDARSRAWTGDGGSSSKYSNQERSRKKTAWQRLNNFGSFEFLRASVKYSLHTHFPRLPSNFLGASVRCMVPRGRQTVGRNHFIQF